MAVHGDGWESGDLRYWQESKHELRYEFTGHERDAHGLTDYMLARTCLYPFYRFASVDPSRDGWNLYAYVTNNPVKYTDPTGEESAGIALDNDIEAVLEGEITKEQYMDRIEARGKVGLGAVSLLRPGPEELLIFSAGKTFATVAGKTGRILGSLARILRGSGKADEAANVGTRWSTEVIKRDAPGADGATSKHLIEKLDGQTNSVTHQVTREGQVIHQHQTHIGKSGARRQFPDEWVEYPQIPARKDK